MTNEAGGTQPNHAGRVEPIAAGRSDAARLIESRNHTVEASLLMFAFPGMSERIARGHAVVINLKRDLHGETAAIMYVHELERRLNHAR